MDTDIYKEVNTLSKNRKMRRALNKKAYKLTGKTHYLYDDTAEYLLNIAECEVTYASEMKRVPRGVFKPMRLK